MAVPKRRTSRSKRNMRRANHDKVTAPNLAAAAQYYPAIYWASMIKFPDQSRFPGTGDKGNGIPETFQTPQQWLNFIKTNGCGNCHQIGNYATRVIPPPSSVPVFMVTLSRSSQRAPIKSRVAPPR